VLVWAVLVAVVAFGYYATRQPHTFMQIRMTDIAASIAVLDRGGPPLLASKVPYGPHVPASELSPVGITDDQGIYVVLPLLGHLTGERDPSVLMQWFFAGCFALLIFVLPLIVFELFESLAVAAVAPLSVFVGFDSAPVDLYWIMAWCMLLCLPGLLLAYRWWHDGLRRRATALLVALLVAAGFATSIRVDAGLPVLIGGLGIVLFAGTDRWRHPRSWSLRLSRAALARPLAAVLLVIAYLSLSSFALTAIRDYRNSVIHQPSFGSTWPTQHPFWHNAYIGLGYRPNRYGIAWSDAVAADVVERVHPGTQYLSPLYETTLRHAYLHLLRHDPGFVLGTLWTKARVLLADALRRFWLAPALLALGLLIARRRREAAVAAAVTVPALVIGASAPILTLPTSAYAMGWLGAWGALWLLGIGWTLAEGGSWIRQRRGRRIVTDLPLRPALLVAGIAVLSGVVAVTVRPAPPPSAVDFYEQGQSALAARSSLARPAPARWRFAGSLPQGWRRAATGVTLERDDGQTAEAGLHVTTQTAPDAAQLTSPALTLPPGRYELVGEARILVGGMALRVSDARTGALLASSRYWAGEGDFADEAIAASFVTARARKVRIALANWTPFPNASAWVLWRLAIERTGGGPPPPGAYYRPRADALIAPAAVGGSTLHDWIFANGVPRGWSASGSPVLSNAAPGLRLVTTAPVSAYQLQSDTLTLLPGRYTAEVAGRVAAGGLELGVLDVKRNAWIVTRHFWHGQQFDGRAMTATVTLPRATAVQLILSNWAPRPAASTWIVDRVSFVRLP